MDDRVCLNLLMSSNVHYHTLCFKKGQHPLMSANFLVFFEALTLSKSHGHCLFSDNPLDVAIKKFKS